MGRVWLSGLAGLSFVVASSFATLPQPAGAAKVCPDIERPVCAVTPTGQRQRFTNACFAGLAHARVLHGGDCIASPDGICMMIVVPVCAIDPATRKKRTYPNLCQAEAANATFVSDGPCPGQQPASVTDNQVCIQVISCGTKNGKRKEYPTPCAAQADGATDITPKVGPTCAATQ